MIGTQRSWNRIAIVRLREFKSSAENASAFMLVWHSQGAPDESQFWLVDGGAEKSPSAGQVSGHDFQSCRQCSKCVGL